MFRWVFRTTALIAIDDRIPMRSPITIQTTSPRRFTSLIEFIHASPLVVTIQTKKSRFSDRDGVVIVYFDMCPWRTLLRLVQYPPCHPR
jgi:hypothetical protein